MELETLKLFLFISLFYLNCHQVISSAIPSKPEDRAVTNLRNYLRIPTVHPNPEPGYEQAIPWLHNLAREIGLDFTYIDLPTPNDFTLWMTWNGSNPSLKSILLNSHMDVVAAEAEKWTYPPFEAHKDENGYIYGRGATDMKSVTIGQLEAIRKLKLLGFQPLRTVHILVMPGEETGGMRGMKPFVESDYFKNLNVGVDIDEGLALDSENKVYITYAEKSIWQFNITVRGQAMHASGLPQYTAGQRLQAVIDKLFEYRKSEFDKLQDPGISIQDLTSLNLIRIGGGTGDNTIPSELWASFDMRIRLKPNWNFTNVENILMNIIEEANLGSIPNGVTINFIHKSLETGQTVVNNSNVWWTVIQNTCLQLNITCEPIVLQAVTDGRFVRNLGIPAFGIIPFPNTPLNAHQVDERISEVEFLRGIDRYTTFIRNLAVLPSD